MKFRLSADGLVLQWDDAAQGMKLQQTPTLTIAQWQDVEGSESTSSMTVPIASRQASQKRPVRSE